MKTSHFLFAALAVGLGFSLSTARALTVQEGFQITDFPDSAAAVTAAFTYTLTTGSNVFSGTIAAFSGDSADFFKFTVAPGTKVTAVFTNGASGISVPGGTLYAGTYTASCSPGQIISDVNWSITFTVAAGVPDYEVTTTGGQVVINDRSSLGGTLALSEPFGGTIQFSTPNAPGRTFSVDGGAFITGNSGPFIPFNDLSNPTTAVIVNGGTGNNTINVGNFSRTAAFPALTINGNTGDETVNFNGNLTLRVNRSLFVDLQNDAAAPGVDSVNVAAGANVTTAGAGAIRVACSRSVTVAAGGSLISAASITVRANQQATPTAGDFIGVNVSGGTVAGSGGFVQVSGRGGNAAGGGQIGGFNVNVVGTGGAGGGQINRGVTVIDAGSRITSSRFLFVAGQGGGTAASDFNVGVTVLSGGVIGDAAGTASVQVSGTGGNGGFFNQGIELGGAGAAIATSGGSYLNLLGTPGAGTSVGIFLANAGAVSDVGGEMSVRTDSLSIDGTASIAGGSVTLQQRNVGGLPIDVGGADPTGKLSLSDAVLDRITTANLILDRIPRRCLSARRSARRSREM